MGRNLHRIIFLGVGIILFTAQFSYKFFAYSSRPAFGPVTRQAPSNHGHPHLLHAHHFNPRLALSLDKRYTMQKAVVLGEPVFNLALPRSSRSAEPGTSGPQVWHRHPNELVALRGPPVA
jgi:hypothetical protein